MNTLSMEAKGHTTHECSMPAQLGKDTDPTGVASI